jgi:glutathionylspermidine synthase
LLICNERSERRVPPDPAIRYATAVLDELRDPRVLEEACRGLEASLTRRGIFFGDGLLPTSPAPFFAPGPSLDAWIRKSEALAAVVEEVAREALHDPALGRALALRPDANAWVEIDPGYPTICVLARPDAVLCGDGIEYVEYNSDSPAMMAFSDHVGDCLLELSYLRRHAHALRTHHMLPALLDTLLGCYRAYGGSGNPTIAIVDWPNLKTRFEHARIAEYFESRGCGTIVCDPRALRRNGKKLEHEGRTIDLVYRRALFTELLDRHAEVTALIDAYRDGAVCMVNPLRSYLASSKTLLAFLCERWPAGRGECTVIPTKKLDPARIAALRTRDEAVVLKKGESHGGLHVLLPGLSTAEQRREALDEALREPWVEQEYRTLPKLRVPTSDAPTGEKFYNWNPFLFSGRYAGSITRASESPLINITLGGALLPTMRVDV